MTSIHSPNRPFLPTTQQQLINQPLIEAQQQNNKIKDINKLDTITSTTTSTTTLQIVRPAPLKKLPTLPISTINPTSTTSASTSTISDGSGSGSNTTITTEVGNNTKKKNYQTDDIKLKQEHIKIKERELKRRQEQSIQKKKLQQRQRQEQKIQKKKQQCTFPLVQPFQKHNMMESKNEVKQPSHAKSQHSNSIDNTLDNQMLHEQHETTTTTPLFERLQTEEIQELKSYNRMITLKNHQISTFETLLEDLESRLEQETLQKLKLQDTLDTCNVKHKKEKMRLENDVDMWKNRVQVEKMKNKKLLEEVNKKDKEIHKMMQRKYDAATIAKQQQQQNNQQQPQNHQHRNRISNSNSSASLQTTSKNSSFSHKSPHEILAASGNAKTVRQRNVANSLLDFFGM